MSKYLTPVVLNKFWCHANFQLSANQIAWSRLLLNDKQCRCRSVGFFRNQLIWIYTVCKGRVYPGSAWQGFRVNMEIIFLILPKALNQTNKLINIFCISTCAWHGAISQSKTNSKYNLSHHFTPFALKTKTGTLCTFANSTDPAEMTNNKPSHQDLQHLLFCSWFTTVTLLAAMDVSKCWDGRVYFRNSGLKGVNMINTYHAMGRFSRWQTENWLWYFM